MSGNSRSGEGGRATALPDLVCLSHLRWDFVFQRPQHLMTRFARDRRVFFVEEPVIGDGPDRLSVRLVHPRVWVATPHLARGHDAREALALQRQLLDQLHASRAVDDHVLWYYTPMARRFTRHLAPRAIVYDCMDELSAFRGAPPELRPLEAELLACADLVTTGGQSLYEAKRGLHPNVHAFPSSVDVAHFARARAPQPDPLDQAAIARPRVGYYGVIDERLDLELVAGLAAARPDLQIVLLGPVAKIDPASVPRAPNVHMLGARSYAELPSYVAGWDVAFMPFARNEATRFISPTKTPEYLAAGRPVVSTPIHDVVHPYGDRGLALIAGTLGELVAAIDESLRSDAATRLRAADAFLARTSWDRTFDRMKRLVDAASARRGAEVPLREGRGVGTP